MSIRSKQNLFVILLAGALAFGLSSAALAQNTPSGTTITNTAAAKSRHAVRKAAIRAPAVSTSSRP